MIIIGITGSQGAGKGTVVEYLKTHKGFIHFSARVLLAEELEKRGLPTNDRNNFRTVANDLRSLHSPSYIIEQLYRKAEEADTDCIIESIRTTGEIDALRKIGHFYLFAVTADLPTRYERILLRGSETDNVSFEEFVEQNKKEEASTDPHNPNISACVAKADFVIENNGDVEALYTQIEEVFKKIS